MSIRGFIGKLGKVNLEGKLAAAFDTYAGKAVGQAVKKMEKRISEKAPGMKLVTPGLSVQVKGLRGPIAEEELPKCKEFGVKIANQLKSKA
jgi:flavorubredoxin